ncbi:MAG TPA: ATP-binding protein [Thiobacillus sp.]|nr:ATP-binding protein [Thiobacillus sp.]
MLEEILIPPDMAPMHYNDHWPWPVWQIGAGICDCRQPIIARERMNAILGQPGIPDDCYRFTFDNFQAAQYREALNWAVAFVASDALVSADGKERTGLLLSGTPGVGKTTLGSLVFRARVEKGQLAAWIKFTDWMRRIRATYDDGYEGKSVDELRQAVQYAPFLLIDDLGSQTRGETYAEDVIELLFLIFDHRWAKRLPTLVTTNLTETELIKQFGAPVVSRMLGLCHIVIVRGPDARRKS